MDLAARSGDLPGLYFGSIGAGVAFLALMGFSVYVIRSRSKSRNGEVRLHHALDLGRMATWKRDLRIGRIVWDERMYDIFAATPGQLIDRERFFPNVVADDVAALRAKVDTTERTALGQDCDFRYRRPDGRIVWIPTKVGLRLDHNGSPTHVVGTNLDISERKEAEARLRELRELDDELDQRVAQRTEELAESCLGLRALVAELTRVEQRDRRRVAVEQHDCLTQTLTATRMNLSRADKLLSRTQIDGGLTAMLRGLSGNLDHAISYTRTLIGELSPRVLYELGLAAALRWLGAEMAKRRLRMDVDGEADASALNEDDSVSLFQCARELLRNVVKHGATDYAKITFGLDRRHASLVVADHGQGFAVQSVRGNGGNDERYGLFSIQERVSLRGGQVEIDSLLGVGTWVTVILPVQRNEAVVKPTACDHGQHRPLVRSTITAVIVDDHQMVRHGLRQILEANGEIVIVGQAGDGAEAIDLARLLKPDVVIVDVNLPTMSGIDATREIVRHLPAIVVVGVYFGCDEYVVEAMRSAGAVICIPKDRAVVAIRQAILDGLAERPGDGIDNQEMIVNG